MASSPVRLSLLVLKTHQLERLCSFYQALGMALQPEQHGSGPLHYSAELNGLILELYPLPLDQAVCRDVRLGFTVTNLNGLLASLEAIGTEVAAAPRSGPWGRRAIVRDPDGRAVELVEHSQPGG